VNLQESLGKIHLPGLLRGAESMANAVLANCYARALALGKSAWDKLLSKPLFLLLAKALA